MSWSSQIISPLRGKLCVSSSRLGGINPLIGSNNAEFGPRFPPMSDAYDVELRKIAFRAANHCSVTGMQEGVYSFVPGPSFETRAESRFVFYIFNA